MRIQDLRSPFGLIPMIQRPLRAGDSQSQETVLSGSTWGQQNETLLMTYKAIERSIVNYAAPVWSTNASKTSLDKIQIAQNEALRIARKMLKAVHTSSVTRAIYNQGNNCHLSAMRNPLSTEDNGQLFLSTQIWSLQTSEQLQKSPGSNCQLTMHRLWNGSTRYAMPLQLHGTPNNSDAC